MADTILGAWWDRLRGRLQPRPCPYALAGALEMPGRRLIAGPQRVLAAFGVDTGQTVLEMGTGTGFYSIEAARRVGPQGRLICLDLQADMLRHARTRLAAAGASAYFVRADACALPIRTARIDHAVAITVLGQIPDRPRAPGRSPARPANGGTALGLRAVSGP